MRPFSFCFCAAVVVVVVVGVVVCGGGCFDGAVGAAALSCEGNADCPAPLKCQAGRCVDDLDDRAPDVVAGSVVVENGGLTRGALPLIVRFAVDEALPALPRVRAVMPRAAADLDVVADGAGFVATLDVAARAGVDVDEGALDLVVDLADAAGNARAVEIARGAAVVDVTAPRLRDGLSSTTLTPPAGALVDVTDLGAGGSFVVDLLFDEAVAAVSASTGVATVVDSAAVDAAVHVVVVASDVDGTASVDVVVADAAGNVADFAGVASVVVDVTAPALDASGLVLERRPQAATPSTRLRGAVDAGPRDRLVVLSTNEPSRGALLASFPATSTVFELGFNDLRTAFVAVVDAAGNASAVREVPRVRYVAFGGPTSPHRLRATPRLQQSVAQPFAVDVDADVVAREDGSALDVEASAVWIEQSNAEAALVVDPAFALAAYDSGRGDVVVLGARPEAYRWNGRTLTRLTTAAGPRPLLTARTGATFDGGRGEVVVVDSAEPMGVWGFDGARWRRRADLPDGLNGGGVALAYDVDSDRVWLLATFGRLLSLQGDVVVDHGQVDLPGQVFLGDDLATHTPLVVSDQDGARRLVVGDDGGPAYVDVEIGGSLDGSSLAPSLVCSGREFRRDADVFDAARGELLRFTGDRRVLRVGGRGTPTLAPLTTRASTVGFTPSALGALSTLTRSALGSPLELQVWAGGGYHAIARFDVDSGVLVDAVAHSDAGVILSTFDGLRRFRFFDDAFVEGAAEDVPDGVRFVSGGAFFVAVDADSLRVCRVAGFAACEPPTVTGGTIAVAVDELRGDLWFIDATAGLGVVRGDGSGVEAFDVDVGDRRELVYDTAADALLIGGVGRRDIGDNAELGDWLVFVDGALSPMPQAPGVAPVRRSGAMFGADARRGGAVVGLGTSTDDNGEPLPLTDTWVLESYATARPAVVLDVDANASGLLASHDLVDVSADVSAASNRADGVVVVGWAAGVQMPLTRVAADRYVDVDGVVHVAVAAHDEVDGVPGRVVSVNEFSVMLEFVKR